MPIKPGDRFGRYEIRAEIGSGAMGHVFHAHDSRLDRAVALKLIGHDREHHPQARARFEQEGRSASALNHPNIVTTYDIGEESGRLFIVMELLDGQRPAPHAHRPASGRHAHESRNTNRGSARRRALADDVRRADDLLEVVEDEKRWSRRDIEFADHRAWAVRMGVALFSFWEDTDHLSEGRRVLSAIMQLPGAQEDESAYARLLFCAGVLASIQGDNAEAIARNEMGLALYQRRNDHWGIAVSRNALGLQNIEIGELDRAASHLQASLVAWKNAGDKSGYARSLSNLAFVRRQQGSADEARKLYDEAAQLFVRIGDRTSGAWALNQQGDVARDQMQLDDAERYYKSAIDAFRDLDDQWGVASCIADLRTVARQRGDLAGAVDFYRQALAIFSSLGHRRGVARILELMSILAARLGASERALTLSSAAARFRETIGVPGPVNEQKELAAAVEQASMNLSSAIADGARRRGYGMTLTEAIRYAESQE